MLFKEQYSKNFLKANYNSTSLYSSYFIIQRTILKELFESKLQQHLGRRYFYRIQRTILKELFESKLQPKSQLYASKPIQRTILKELFESKLQLLRWFGDLVFDSKNNTQRTF